MMLNRAKALFAAVPVAALSIVPAFAAESPAPAVPTWDTFKPVADAITGTFSVSTIVGFLASIIGIAIGFALMWFVVKRVIRMIMGAINGGNISSGASNRRRGR